MRIASQFILASLILVVAGCAVRRPPAQPAERAAPATQPSDPRAFLALDEIQPPPAFPTSRPVADPAAPTPLEALELYARARAMALDNQPKAAIDLLIKAIAIDPDSFELYFALGQAWLASNSGEKALAAFHEAAEIQPDHLPLQLQLARQYLAMGKEEQGLEHLRLARQTKDYSSEEDQSTMVDYFLARALEQQGYDRAARELYERLLHRLAYRRFSLRGNSDLAQLMSRPETLYVQIGRLYEKHADYARALTAYEMAAQRDKDNFELQSRIARMLLALNRDDAAARYASELLLQFKADSDSVALLNEVYGKIGREGAVIGELRRLYKERPKERSLLFAIADQLNHQGRAQEAVKLLSQAADENPDEVEIVKRLFALHEKRDDIESAARLLVEQLARRPDSLREISPLWTELLRVSRGRRLRLPQLEKLEVSEGARASKLFWISRVAELWHRDALARGALEQSVRISPPFAPAYRVLLGEIWSRDDWDERQKESASKNLAQTAAEQGDAALAAEVRGLTLLNQKQADQAAAALAEAIRLGAKSPDLQLAYAAALRRQGNNSRAEQLLWKLAGDRPTYSDVWSALFHYYIDRGSPSQALKVLAQWMAADPENVSARLLQASLYFQGKRIDAAEKMLLKLFEENSENAEVIASLQSLYRATGRIDQFIAKLEEQRRRQPGNHDVVQWLVEIYADQKQLAEAARVLDAMQESVGNDPDLLYYVAHLYTRIEQKQTTDEVLQQVIRLDPLHAPASNDLGYSWADQGKNLDEAESLIRAAVQAEPDNQSFLDSLGWVLYKRGKYQEARGYLEQAIGSAANPDPVVLDHLGDVIYRLGDHAEAGRQWERSLQRLDQTDSNRDDLKQLRLKLQQKLKQAAGGQPVNVAPAAQGTIKAQQVKN